MKRISYTSNFSAKSTRSTRSEKSFAKKCCSSFLHLFTLNGHLSYAFIYGSWEIIRARKVGTTHTKVDYVVYRLFYPFILIAVCLFSVVAEEDFSKFFCLLEVWCLILHIIYAFIFLQNVLQNNLHRDNVKHRQIIPERIAVTDEIEKGGHKYYICKRYSILPTEKLYYTESAIWMIYNVLFLNITLMLGRMTGQLHIQYKQDDQLGDLRCYAMGSLILADVILTPIPVRFAHCIFPVIVYISYLGFLSVIYDTKKIVIYASFDKGRFSNHALIERCVAHSLFVVLLQLILAGLAALRDYVISLLDDSRTPKQLQNLRSQKRLARRKLMNYIEGPDGRITGISLERHVDAPRLDEFITKAQRHTKSMVTTPLTDGDDSDDDEDDSKETKKFKNEGDGDTVQKDVGSLLDAIPLSTKIKPPPQLRYKTPEKDETQFSSSSSSSMGDSIEAIKRSIKRLPSPPKPPNPKIHEPQIDAARRGSVKEMRALRQIAAPVVPLKKFGIVVKPRDSKENIHQKMEHGEDGQITPPFVRLVKALVKAKKQVKEEVDQQRKLKLGFDPDGTAIHTAAGSAFVKLGLTNKAQENQEQDKTLSPTSSMQAAGQQVIKKPIGSTRGRGGRRVAPARLRVKKADNDFIDQMIKDATLPSSYTKQKEKEESEMANKLSSDDQTASKRPRLGLEITTATRDKPIRGSRVVHLKGLNIIGEKREEEDSMLEFNKELADKLQKEQNKRLGIPVSGNVGNKKQGGQGLKPVKKQKKQLKSILKHTEFGGGGGEMLPSEKLKRRKKRLLRRREERALLGKHGLPAYDPMAVPQNVGGIATTYHYLGTKLKGEKADKLTVDEKDLPLYKTHLGVGTKDDKQVEGGDNARATSDEGNKNLVAFHPIVKYFEVNEVGEQQRRTSSSTGTRQLTKK